MNFSPIILLGNDDENLRAEIRQIAPNCEIVGMGDFARAHIIYEGVKPNEIAGAANLRWLQLFSAGVNRWPLGELGARGVTVTTTSGIHAGPIVEQMFGMLLMSTRALDVAAREQPKHDWHSFDYGARVERIGSKTLGVLGVGAIGAHAARVGKAFGMRVIGLRRGGHGAPDVDEMFAPDARREFFAQSDVVMNTLPLTEDTRGFMGASEFAALPDGAIVINTGRGETIDTDALMEWAKSERARAALLDVTDPEPLPANHPLWDLDKVFITPHYSGNHPDYTERANAIFLENLRRFVAGETLLNVVDVDAGY